jgi:hypothetical protein
MGIVFQEVVQPDTTYEFTNPISLNTLFDIHNDTPYNLGVSFGKDTGIAQAQHYLSPQTVAQSVPAPGTNKAFSVRTQATFGGTVYLYTQTPMGGTTNYASAPAQTITVVSFAPGDTPQAVTSLNRMQNVGNGLQTTVTSTQNTLSNDGAAASTIVIESTEVNSTGSNVSIDNSGNAFIAEYVSSVYQKLLQTIAGATIGVILGASNRAVQIIGDLFFKGTLGVTTAGDVLDATSTSNTYLKVRGASGNIILQANGSQILLVDSTGSIGVASARDIIDTSSSTATYFKGRGTNANAILQAQGTGKAYLISGGLNSLYADGNNGVTFLANAPINASTSIATFGKVNFNTGGIKDLNTFTGTGSGTFNHGLSGTPTDCWVTCSVNGSTQTVGAANFTSTQVTITVGAGLAWRATAYR